MCLNQYIHCQNADRHVVVWLLHLGTGYAVRILSGANMPHPHISTTALCFALSVWKGRWCSGGCVVCHNAHGLLLWLSSTQKACVKQAGGTWRCHGPHSFSHAGCRTPAWKGTCVCLAAGGCNMYCTVSTPACWPSWHVARLRLLSAGSSFKSTAPPGPEANCLHAINNPCVCL